MEGKNPVILSSDPKVKETFRKMIADTTDAIIGSYDDNTAYSGKNVYKLRKSLEDLGFLRQDPGDCEKGDHAASASHMVHNVHAASPCPRPH